MKEIAVGTAGTQKCRVAVSDLAVTVGSGSLEVFATPMLIAMMEKAAVGVLAEFLDDGETSVGTAVNIEHTAATPIGMEVSAHASITAVKGREVTFAVEASDEKGKIGGGTHKRFVVLSEKFMAKTAAKLV